MSWQILATLISLVIPVLGILNAWLLNQVRLEISALKIEMLTARAADKQELRSWVEAEFQRKEELHAKLEAVTTRMERLENRRRRDESRAA